MAFDISTVPETIWNPSLIRGKELRQNAIYHLLVNGNCLERLRDKLIDEVKFAAKARTIPKMLSSEIHEYLQMAKVAVNALLEHHAALEEADVDIEHRQLCIDTLSNAIDLIHSWVESIDRHNYALMSQTFKLKSYRKALAELVLHACAVDRKLRKLGGSVCRTTRSISGRRNS